MSFDASSPRWIQFRRLLLGTVVELMLDSKIQAQVSSIRIVFDSQSDFRVPRLDNYMRFKGHLVATLTATPERAALASLEQGLKKAWPVLLSTIDLPIGDRLTSEREQVAVTVVGDTLRVEFDLEAD